MKIHWVNNAKILNKIPFDTNLVPQLNQHYLWVDMENSLFEKKYHKLLFENYWKVTETRFITTSDESSFDNMICFATIEAISPADKIIHYDL